MKALGICLAFLVALTAAALGRGFPAGSIGFNTGPTIIKMATDSYEATGISNAGFIGKNQLATYNGNQYLCYYNTTLNPIIVKRNLSTNGLTSFNPSLPAVGTGITTNNDVHKSCSIELDSTGYIHLAYGMHAVPMIYYRSNNTEDPSAFTSETPMVNSTVENSSTYPMFVKNPSTGALYFTFRSGSAGSGDQYLYAYNTSTKTWAGASGSGTNGIIIQASTNSPTFSAYMNGLPKWDSSGNLWFQWQFYEATSADTQGEYLMQWTGSALKDPSGGSLTAPVTVSTSPRPFTLAQGIGLIDQADFAVDQSSGKFYVGESHKDVNSEYQSYVLTNYTGSWVENAITSFSSGTSQFPYCSPAGGGEQPTMLAKSGTGFAIYPNAYLLGFGPPTMAWKSSNGFSSFTTEVVTQSMNPNNAVAFDPDRISSGIASMAFENWTQGYGVSCSYPFPDSGTIYVIDWTIG